MPDDDRAANVAPTPDLADIPVKPTPDTPADSVGRHPDDPPVEDLTLPTE